MKTRIIEATNAEGGGGINWGKFMVAQYDTNDWLTRSTVDAGRALNSILAGRGWTQKHAWVLDLQTGEGACFLLGGSAEHDLNEKHRIWVCPLYLPFLRWLYKQSKTTDPHWLDKLPAVVRFTEDEAPSALAGYRRGGGDDGTEQAR